MFSVSSIKMILVSGRMVSISSITKSVIFSSLLMGFPAVAFAAGDVTFDGSMLRVIEEIPERNTGLDKIFVLYDDSGVNMVYSTDDSSRVKIYKFGNLGGGYAEELTDIKRENDRVILDDITGDSGYIIEDGDRRYYYWVVNYLPHRFSINSVEAEDVPDCDASVLRVDGFAPAIHYFTINGQQKVLSRDIKIRYSTQEWSNSEHDFVEVDTTDIIEYFDQIIRVTPPSLCHSSFNISGDRFLEAWNWKAEAESIVIAPTAVKVVTEAIQDGYNSHESNDSNSRDSESDDTTLSGDDSSSAGEDEDLPSNQIRGDESTLGGSAPADIEFNAYVTQGVLHYEWQMSSDPEFEEIDYRFNEQNLSYTFLEEGTFYLRFIGSNSDGSCEAVGDTYTVSIGASELLCPNAFTPDGDGVNDLWRVSYRSLVEFECWIFDRYGAQLYNFKDPEGGWDGKYGGKLVKPGVYFYVITAVGADGKKYKKSGDINILRRRAGDNIDSPAGED